MDEDLRAGESDGRSAADPGEAAYRGFLFADLRGYTAFVERHGDAAAADLLDAYRELVRAEVARHAGAEIRTEGDSFYVVFGSARRAVACALAIVAEAEQATREHPERPINVGIGINAGETVQRGEGFVGTAVNLAARVCAQAREGEVLVTAAVRDAIGASPGLQLIPRGTRRLKGIGRPVALFAVRPAVVPGGPAIAAPRRGWLPIAAGLLGAAAVAGAVFVLGSGIARPGASNAVDPTGSQAASTPASPAVSASATREASPQPDPGVFPNEAEAEILTVVGEDIEPHCDRADEDDRPVIIIDPVNAEAFGITAEERVASHVGIACELPGALVPDTFYLWEARQIIDYRSVDVPSALIANRAGRFGISPGQCGTGEPAREQWRVGNVSGWLLCHDLFGPAVIEWSYDDSTLFGRATRADGDVAALLAWWTEEARLWAP